MGLNTDFNISPYYDDFDENKNFHRVLFKPGVAVQARELTQLQTILQNQVERFGNNILVEGTIIDGCNFTEVKDLNYAKVLDLNTNGQPIVLSDYVNMFVYGQTTGIKAKIQTYAEGLESDGTNLKTVFFKYLSSGTNTDVTTFSTSENLIVVNSSNSTIDTITVAGNILSTPSTAIGHSYGVKVSDGIIYQKGFFVAVDSQLAIVSKYTNSPNNVVVGFTTQETIVNSNEDTSLLDNANGFNNYQAPGADRLKLTPVLTVMTTEEADADDTFFAIQEYMYGRVVRRNNSTQYNVIMDIIEKRTKDESGNYTVKDFNISISNNSVVEMSADQIMIGSSYTIVTPGTTSFTSIGADSNISGTIFTANAVGTGTGTVKPNVLALNMGAGVAYVEGKRVELLNKYSIDLPKATTYATEKSQNITTNYGNYILVNEYMGKFDFHQASTIYLFDAVQTNSTANTIGANTGNKIGQASVASITLESGTPGNANTVYRMYLFNIKMDAGKNWSDTKAIIAPDAVGTADLVDTTIYDPNFKRRIFPTGASALKKLPSTANSATASYISRTSSTANISSNSMSITPAGAEWPYTGTLNSTQKKDLLLIAGMTASPYVKDKPIDLTNAVVSVTGTTLTIANLAAASVNNCILYYNIKYDGITAPTQKTLETVYVKINCANSGSGNTANSSGPWSLGFPNVYSIEDVWVSSNSSYPMTNSKKSYFVLNKNQQSDFYGLSTMSVKPGSGVSNTSYIVAKLKVLKKDSTDKGFFSVSSYPVNDILSTNTTIQTESIPTFKDSNNAIYVLRDCVDFRPYAVNTAVYAADATNATVNPSAAITFDSDTDLKIPAPNEALITDYEYYLGRKDILLINEYGDFALKEGVPSSSPKQPTEPSIGMVLADLEVPPFPSLNVGITKRNHRRYTMKDVNDLDQRLQNVEYYTALNLLETKTKDIIVSDANGNNRFKNGIFVDDFQSLDFSDILDPSWAGGWNSNTNEITPHFIRHPLELKYDTGANNSNIELYRDNITLKKSSDIVLLEQPKATANIVTTTNTTNVNGKLEIYPQRRYGSTTSSNRKYATSGWINIRVTGLKANTKYYITLDGQHVVAMPAYYANTANEIQGLKQPGYGSRSVPNSSHYGHYSEEAPEVFPGQSSHSDYKWENYYVYSDSNGLLLAMLQIYQNKLPLKTSSSSSGGTSGYIIGVMDATTTKCQVVYNVIDMSSSPNGAIIPVGSATFVSSSVTTTNTTYTSDAIPFDHLSQTFKIDTNKGKDSVVFLDKLDLYFSKKSTDTSKGVTIEVYETINGLPDPTKTLSTTYIKNSSINVSTNGNTATTVTLSNPIALKTNAMYAVAIIADQHDPNFVLYIAKNGDYDLVNTTQKVTFDTLTGSLYTSTNGLSWISNSQQRIKFRLYSATYNKNGTAYLTNVDHEFFTLKDYTTIAVEPDSIQFHSSELVAIWSGNVASISATVNSSNLIITSNSSAIASNFAAGDYIGYWANSSVIDVKQIASVNAAANSVTLTSYPEYSVNNAVIFKTIVGEVSYHDEDNNILHLKNSSANSTVYFAANDVLIGSVSGTKATINTVDDIAIGGIDANIEETNYLYTTTKYTTQILKGSGTYSNVAIGEEFTLVQTNTPNTSVVIPSTSREFANNTGQGFRLRVDLNNTETTTPYDSTPTVNVKQSVVDVFEYAINNDATDEDGARSILGGNALSRHITTTVSLAENLDAEDIVVYLTAYKPVNSNLNVYVRFKNKNDNRDMYDIEWTKLNIKDNPVSSSTNLYDYRELEYRMPTAPNSNTTNIPVYSGAKIDTSNNVLTYRAGDGDGAIYTGYKDFAIKIVYLTSDKKSIPRVKDIRAIALT